MSLDHIQPIEPRRFRLAQVIVHLWRDRAARFIDDLSLAGQINILTLSDEDDLMLWLSAEVASEMQVLAGAIRLFIARSDRGSLDRTCRYM